MSILKRLLPGLALSAAVAVAAIQLGTLGWLQAHGMSALTAAIVLGIILGNTLYPRIAAESGAGVAFSKQTLLRAGVILYGLRLTLHDIGQVGFTGVLIDALLLTSTFALAHLLGTRVFGMDRATATLIGAGNAICGAAAVMATEPLLKAKSEQVTVAISTVVVFGTVAIFVYPALYALNLHWQLVPAGTQGFGIYAGSTIHEVAQVFAAGRSISADTANTAVITKMVRVMMLAPFLIALSGWMARRKLQRPAGVGRPGGKVTIPWFAFAFIGMVMFNSLALLPHAVVGAAIDVDTFLLAMAMGALGLTTHLAAIRRAGVKPLLLGALLFVWLVGGGALINSLVWGLHLA
ncbi:MAG TPA: YeiH family protein [Steroidobacteraceae bacterium]|nr:YeiH family protein [Steroidobacteraceae bacterium]